jgi:hypothetical protein
VEPGGTAQTRLQEALCEDESIEERVMLVQEQDSLTPDMLEFECVSEAQPTEEMLEDLKFAWLCVKHVKSNAITVGKGKRLLGMGSGQPNRVKSTQIALEKVRTLLTLIPLAKSCRCIRVHLIHPLRAQAGCETFILCIFSPLLGLVDSHGGGVLMMGLGETSENGVSRCASLYYVWGCRHQSASRV